MNPIDAVLHVLGNLMRNSTGILRSKSAGIALALAGLFAVAPPLHAQTRVFEVPTISPVAEVPLTLAQRAGGHTIELRNFDQQNAPVLDVVAASGDALPGLRMQAGGAAIVLPAATAGKVTLIVRSRAPDASQVADVWVDGALLSSKVRFSSGTTLRMPGLGVGEEVVGIAAPNGPSEHAAYLMSADGARIVARAAGRVTRLRPRTAGDAVIVIASLGENATGRLRVYRNDYVIDTDGEGLGDELEDVLGTCASRLASIAGVSCAALADPRDTDSDGLWDAWELFGVNGQALPTWGADPRHKDIFIEVDFRRETLADNQNGVARHMMPAVARQMAGIYADSATTDPATRAMHAQDVGNPDGQPGVNLHLDTGVAPATPADATIYGDWGGYTPVDAVPDGSGGYVPQDPATAMASNMIQARRGLFHYVLGYTTGGGSCGPGIVCGFNMASLGNSAHEFGHTLFLHHNGPFGTVEPNCKPNYASLMNYAFYDGGYLMFSDGRTLPTLNNHSLVETGIVSPNDATFLDTLKREFLYKVDAATGSVDWNRDGIFAPATAPVRAYGNLRPYGSGGCEFTREGEQLISTKSQRSPAVVRYYNHIWIFSVTLEGKLDYTYTLPVDVRQHRQLSEPRLRASQRARHRTDRFRRRGCHQGKRQASHPDHGNSSRWLARRDLGPPGGRIKRLGNRGHGAGVPGGGRAVARHLSRRHGSRSCIPRDRQHRTLPHAGTGNVELGAAGGSRRSADRDAPADVTRSGIHRTARDSHRGWPGAGRRRVCGFGGLHPTLHLRGLPLPPLDASRDPLRADALGDWTSVDGLDRNRDDDKCDARCDDRINIWSVLHRLYQRQPAGRGRH
jgi:hypothetical protein